MIITNAPRLPADTSTAFLVTIELLDENRQPVVGYVIDTPQSIVGRLQFSANGQNDYSEVLSEWSVDLVPNAWIEPAGTVYRITEVRGRALAALHIIEVPEDDGPFTVLETLVESPGSAGSQLLDHLASEPDRHDAADISVEAGGGIESEDVQSALLELAATDTAEAAARAAADTAEASTRAAADTAESTARSAADTTLTTNLAAETTARGAAITAEAATRAAADTAESSARAAADTAEATARAAADSTETTARLAHEADTTGVHGIADTSLLATTAAVTTEATTRAAADTALSTVAATHAALTTNVHGITDTAGLATSASVTAEASTRAAADTAESSARAAADTTLTTNLAAHLADSTAVHGIADTSAVVLTNDARLSDQRVPTANSVDNSKVPAGALGIDRLAVNPLARGGHTGTQTADSISDLTATIRANRLDQMAAPAASVNLNSQRMTNGTLPVAGTDLITKDYADALRAGLLLKADPVRVMLDTNTNINAPGSVLDSIALSAGDRVLLTGQTSANDNGIYVWNGAAVPMTRAADANTDAEMRSGTAIWITAGTYEDQRWALISADPITLGVTNQVWAFDGGLAHVTAGDGLTKTGNRLDVGEGTGLEVGADTVGIAAGGVDTTQLADGAVTTAKIEDLNVTTGKLADSGVTTAKIADLNVTTGKLANLGVTTAKIAAGAVTNAEVNAAAAIDQSKIAGLPAALTARALTPDGLAGTAIMTTGNQEKAGILTLRNAALKLKTEATTSAAPELHFYSAGGIGTGSIDGLAWGIGIDVAAPIDDRARDFVILKAVGGLIDDALYANHRGPLVATWAVGQAPADNAFKLSVIGSVAGGDTTIAAGSNGAALPQSTINVVSTAGFATAGQTLVETDDGPQWVTYTGVTATSFTGCTLGTGTMSTGGAVGDINLGGIKVQMATTHRGPAILIRDSANIDRLMLMGDGTVKGAHELSAATMCVEAHGVTQRPFAMRDIDNSKYIGFEYDGADLLFRSFSSGTDFFRVSAADTAFEALTPFTAHALTADSILVGTAADQMVLGTWGPDSSYVELRNEGESATTGYALIASNAGQTIVNAETNLLFAVGGIANKVIHAGAAQTLGFFGQGPVAQPATPTTLGEVIAALQDLGLVA